MAGKKQYHSGSADEDVLRAAWDWSAEATAADIGAVQISMTPTRRYGVWRIRARLVHVTDGRATGVRVQVEGEFPNAARARLSEYVMALLMQLEREASYDVLRQPQDA